MPRNATVEGPRRSSRIRTQTAATVKQVVSARANKENDVGEIRSEQRRPKQDRRRNHLPAEVHVEKNLAHFGEGENIGLNPPAPITSAEPIEAAGDRVAGDRASTISPKSKAWPSKVVSKPPGKQGVKAKNTEVAVREGEGYGEAEVRCAGVRDNERGKGPEFPVDPTALKVREWREKLQKMLLSNPSSAKEDEMSAVDALFSILEQFEGMNPVCLAFSKIDKVMRYIYVLEPHKVPRDDEFKFRDRAKVLVDKWRQIDP
ncbi:hypothetical protein B0H14DRAFT_2682688 [Mycena olivaceomarginata]|nr:hypothetical protein B0H14DRAFT_2682688 [Mycena olivaceomarginata]